MLRWNSNHSLLYFHSPLVHDKDFVFKRKKISISSIVTIFKILFPSFIPDSKERLKLMLTAWLLFPYAQYMSL